MDLSKFFPSLATGPAAAAASPSPTVQPGNVLDLGADSTVTMKGVDNVLSISPIAKYPSPRPNQLFGEVVIVSPSLICYGVKNNMVRVIDAHTMAKTLLKGHSQPVSDMSFGSSDSIATIALDVRWEVGGAELTAPQAECILWDVRPVDEQTISTRESLRLRAPAGHGMQCVKFHPRSNGQVLVVAHGPDVSAVVLSARLWQLFSQDPTHALGIDSVAALKLTGHTENVNAFEFSEDGSRCVSAGEDGVCCVWALPPLEHILNASALGVLRPLAQIFPEPSQPILHASFVAANVVCLGMAHNTEVAFWSLQQERLQTLRLVPAQQGETAKNKMAVVKGPKGAYIVLADMNNPQLVLVEVDPTGAAKRAACFALANPVFSLTLELKPGDVLDLHCVDPAMIRTYSCPLSNVFVGSGGSRASATPPAAAAAAAPAATAPQGPILSPRIVVSGPASQSSVEPLMASHTPVLSAPAGPATRSPSDNGAQGVSASQLDALIEARVDAMLARLEEAARARDDAERMRQMKLLEVMSATLHGVSESVERAVQTHTSSPEFLEGVAAAVQARSAHDVDRAVKQALAGDRLAEALAASLVQKLQPLVQRAMDEQFRAHLVPAFEAGVADMLLQFREALPAGASVATSGAAAAAMSAKPMSFRERAMMCLAAGQIEEALKLALTAREAPLVHETCSKINLRHLLQTEPAAVSQMILISLLQQLAMDVMTDPVSKLEWLESVALAVVPSAADIAPHLPGIARQAREALMANSHALSSLPAQHATRFRALTYILVSLEGEAR